MQKSEPPSSTITDKDYKELMIFKINFVEEVAVFAAFVCFTAAADPPYIAAACMEFSITLGLLLLYVLKLNKMVTFFFWPLVDVFNSIVAAIFMFVLSLIAVSTYSAKGTLGGGIVGLMAVGLWGVDAFLLFRKITFNQPRTVSTMAN